MFAHVRRERNFRDTRRAALSLSKPHVHLRISTSQEPPSMTTLQVTQSRLSWRTPGVIIICGCLMAILSFGPRSALGFFLTPMSQENGWGRDVFSLALAMQN